MADQGSEPKNKDDDYQIYQQNLRIKKSQTDESFNTKNFIKKMTAKKNDLDEKQQKKITAYMNFSNSSTTIGNSLIPSISEKDQRIKDLEERIKQKDLEFQKMKRVKESDEARFSKLYIENSNYKKKSRQVIAKSMLEAAQARRAQRHQINPKFGYFKDKIFIEGSQIVGIKKKIKLKQQMIRNLEDDKKSKDHEKKQRAMFQAEFLLKEIITLQRQLESLETAINQYKEQQRLAQKETNCQYGKMGWPVVYEHYQALQLLGKGGFGQVYKCYHLELNQTVALKVVNNKFGNEQSQNEIFKHVAREAEVNKNLNHPNIAKFIKLLQNQESRIAFAMQYCSGPELSKYIKTHICIEQKQAKGIIRQIFAALNYLFNLKEKVIHYDIKPANVMFHYGLVKIVDFGLCKPMPSENSRIDLTSQGVGTYWYLPPETFEDHLPQITPKVDVWSAGVIFYELLYGKKPFGQGMSQDKIYNQQIILKNAKKVQFPAQTPKKYKVSEAAKQFIRQCLAYNQEQRLNPNQAYENDYFKK